MIVTCPQGAQPVLSDRLVVLDLDGVLSPLPKRAGGKPAADTGMEVEMTRLDGTTQEVDARWAPFTDPDVWRTTSRGLVTPFRPALIERVMLPALTDGGCAAHRNDSTHC